MKIGTVIERDLTKLCDERLLAYSVTEMGNTKGLYKNVLLHDSCRPFEDGQLERQLKKPKCSISFASLVILQWKS